MLTTKGYILDFKDGGKELVETFDVAFQHPLDVTHEIREADTHQLRGFTLVYTNQFLITNKFHVVAQLIYRFITYKWTTQHHSCIFLRN